tara:strand:- start:1020 stop:2171 length:1152 start_codon:yes stop_codon:yes gene_type:complete
MSTLKVTNIESPSGGGVNAKITDINGGQLSNRNLIINGAMQVSQRATSVTGVANNSDEGYQTLDRFGMYFGNSAGGVCTVSQATDVPSNQGFSNSIKIDVTTADTSVASNHEIYVGHKIESQTVRNSGWNYTSASSYVTLSFWAKSSKAGTYCVSARADDVGAKYYPFEYTLAADTWTKVTHSIPGDSSLVFNNDTGSGLDVRWVLVAGSSRQGGTNGAWGATSTSNMATSNQVNFFDSTSNDFYLTGVQLEFGEVATAFEHRSFGDELARCQRYYNMVAKGNGATMLNFAVYATNNAYGVLNFPVHMRATPTVDSSDGTGHFQFSSAAAQDNFDTLVAGNGSERAIEFRANSSGGLGIGTAGNAGWVRLTDASAFIGVTAEL